MCRVPPTYTAAHYLASRTSMTGHGLGKHSAHSEESNTKTVQKKKKKKVSKNIRESSVYRMISSVHTFWLTD